MELTKKEYGELVQGKTHPTPFLKNLIWAFCVGGLICTMGQGLYELFLYTGLSQLDASGCVSVTLIFLGALFTGLNIFDKIAKHAGAGTLVPITGFANSIVSPAMEFKSEGYVLGMGAKMFTIAGPVLVFGIATSVIYGLALWLLRIL